MQKYEMKIPGWHTQGEIERKLLFANLGGIFATFVFGASAVPYLGHLVQWAASHLPPWQPALSFPNPLDTLIHPNWLTGLIWLAYYLLFYAWALFSPKYTNSSALEQYRSAQSPYYHMSYAGQQQEQELPWQREARAEVLGPFLYRPVEEPEDYDGSNSLFTVRTPKQQTPLSQAWPGEEKYELVERCYASYRKALERYNPAPIDLKTPPTFFYWQKKKLGYSGSTPILPEDFLCEEKFDLLLMLLAQHLYWYNLRELGDLGRGFVSAFTPDHAPGTAFLSWTGNFLRIPTNTYQLLKMDLEQLLHSHQRALILEADAYAALLGQGEQFEYQLRGVRWEMEQRGFTDGQPPTISERIGHLEALNKKAREELRAQGFKVKEPPKFKPPAREYERDLRTIREQDERRRLNPGK